MNPISKPRQSAAQPDPSPIQRASYETDRDIAAARASDDEVDAVVARGPSGTFAVAGIATVIVVAIYFAFYFFAYLPRGVVH